MTSWAGFWLFLAISEIGGYWFYIQKQKLKEK